MNTTTMQQNKTRDIVFIGIFAALIAICSWISIPTTVPFTLQTMGVFTAVGLLGGKRGSLAVLVYILLGLVGLPVFAGFSGGVGVLFGTTGRLYYRLSGIRSADVGHRNHLRQR